MKRGAFGHEHIQLPLDWIEGFDGQGIVLHVSEGEVERLTPKG